MAPPLGYADHVYRQKVKGSFERMDGFGTTSVGSATSVSGGSLRSGNALSNTLDRRGNAISNTLNSIRGDHARGTSMEQPRQSEPYGIWQPFGGRPSYPPNSYQPPMAPELQLASALFHIAVAPTRFAAGVLVGLATMEAGLLVYIGYSLRPTPLTPLYLYAPAALDFYRLKLWLSLGAFVGFTCSHLARSRGNHYFLQPSQYYVDKALQLVYFAMVWIAFAGRSTPWVLATPQQADLRALHPSIGIPGQSTPFDLLKVTWMEFVPYLIAFEILSVVGAVLAFAPTLDEYFEPPPDSTKEAPPRSLALVVSGTGSRATVRPAESSMGAEVAERAAAGGYLFGDGSVIDLQEHLLGLGSSVEGGLSLAVGSWSYRMQMKMARPAPRAPDGTPARQPLPLHAFHRQKYAGRVCTAMCVLVLDAICNLYNDTVILDGAWDLYLSLALVVVPGLLRPIFFIPFVIMVTETQPFTLGLYTVVQKDFGGAMLWGGVSFAATAIAHALRVIRSALGNTRVDDRPSFHTTSIGGVYAFFFALHILLVSLFYIKAIMALRRLANSEYYLHPGGARSNRPWYRNVVRGIAAGIRNPEFPALGMPPRY